jgi:hypothetical protein
MGQPGDLLLIFADALIRSWKQITKFRSATSPAQGSALATSGEVTPSAGEVSGIGGFMAVDSSTPTPDIHDVTRATNEAARKPPPRPAPAETADVVGTHEAGELTEQLMPGVIRDERGVWIAPETED